MNKKYLSVVLFGALMLGAAGTFTGCIDNDEPPDVSTTMNLQELSSFAVRKLS